MTTYDFDRVIDRTGTFATKLDGLDQMFGRHDVTPLWIADLDFAVCPEITAALRHRLDHPVLGYSAAPDSYWNSIINWQHHRHNFEITREELCFIQGVVKGLGLSINYFSNRGDHIVIQPPVYHPFRMVIEGNGRIVSENPLLFDGTSYRMDLEGLAKVIERDHPTMMILCNPHNPAGRVWTADEIAKMNEICQRNGVKVIADEIHCEIVMPGYKYIPFASVSDDCLANSVTLLSPTKGFNIAGLQIANIVCSDEIVRKRINRAININEVCDVNPFGVVALQAAYNESADWLDQMNAYVYDNYIELKSFCHEYLPKLEVLRLEGTYLAWVDVNALEFTTDELTQFLADKANVMVNSGTMYGQKAGQGYIRINLACPRQRLREALNRIGRLLAEYMIDDIEGCPM